jgi:thymidylate synthase (FAD)
MATVSLFDRMGSDRHVAAYAWTSTNKNGTAFTCDEQEIKRIIRFCMKGSGPGRPHASPFGHGHISVYATDIPLFVVGQWERHRTQTYSEESLRYVISPGDFYVPKPEDVRRQVGRPGSYTYEPLDPEVAEKVIAIIERNGMRAIADYREILALGAGAELARTVLPMGIFKRLYATASLRNWLNFLVLRNDAHAQLEIQRCAVQIEAILEDLYPLTMAAWNEFGRPAL